MVVLVLIFFILSKFGVVRFGRSSCNDSKNESIKQLIRDQNASTRKVVYEMKQQQEIHQAVLDNTMEHFEKGIDKMVGVLSEVQQDISKFLSERKNGKD